MSIYRKETKSLFLMAAAGAFAAGCGGGQHGAGSSGASIQTSKAGNAVLTYFGQPKPLLTSSSGSVSVVGQAGATYSTITLEPPPNLADTYLVFTRVYGQSPNLYEVPYTGGTPVALSTGVLAPEDPTASPYGAISFSTPSNAIYSVRPDNTGLKELLFNGGIAADAPAYALDGTDRIAFSDVTVNYLYVAPGTGGAATVIQTNNVAARQAWNPGGTEIAYSVKVGSGSNADLFETSPSGGMATDITPPNIQNAGLVQNATWNADGTTIMAQVTLSGATTSSLYKFSSTTQGYANLTATGDNEEYPCYSPDGAMYAFYRTGANGAQPGIYVAEQSGEYANLVVPDPSDNQNAVFGLAWSPFLPKETVVSATASTFYHKAASGFLLTQTGSQFGSMVAFTANTPADAAIQAPSSTGPDAAPMVFTITADSITEIGYINSYFNPGTTITLTATPQVVVSVDANTGQVDLLAPAAVKASSVKNADGTVTYSGSFKAVYDGKGRNLAPSGASQLIVSPKSGKLISFK